MLVYLCERFVLGDNTALLVVLGSMICSVMRIDIAWLESVFVARKLFRVFIGTFLYSERMGFRSWGTYW